MIKESIGKDSGNYLKMIGEEPIVQRKVAIVGTGQVGATFAFALMVSGVAMEIILINRNRELAEGHAMDLNHGLGFVQPVKIRAGDYADCENADVVVVTAGIGQKPGQSRLDLAQSNTSVFKEVIPEIVKYTPKNLLIVSNPVDILTYVALKVSGYPKNKVFGSGTVLDSSRFRYLLSRHCGVDARNVHAYIVGEHGDTEVPVWSKVSFGAVPFREYCPVCGRNCPHSQQEGIFSQVKEAAYEIIQKKKATYYAIALALVRIVSSVLRDENSILTVSTLIEGYYDITDVCFSVPVILNRRGASKMLKLSLDETELKHLRTSASTLRDILKKIDI